MRVSGRSLDFEDTTVDGQQRDIERTATKIEDQDVAFLLFTNLVETVGDGGCRGFVDDAQDFQASNRSGILGGLTLRVVEVRGHGDDGLLHLLAQVRFRDFLHLRQHHGANLFWRERLGFALELNLDDGFVVALCLDLEGPVLHVALNHGIGKLATNQALGVEHGVRGVHRNLVLCCVTDQTLGVREGNVRRRGVVTLIVGDDDDALILPHTDARVRCAQVDANRTFIQSAGSHVVCLKINCCVTQIIVDSI
eukprot:PhF_6_TR31118/c0_g1_i1/m.45546